MEQFDEAKKPITELQKFRSISSEAKEITSELETESLGAGSDFFGCLADF